MSAPHPLHHDLARLHSSLSDAVVTDAASAEMPIGEPSSCLVSNESIALTSPEKAMVEGLLSQSERSYRFKQSRSHLAKKDLLRFLPPGRLVEVGRGGMTLATHWLHLIQSQGKLGIWIQAAHGALHPPSLAAADIDLAKLCVVHIPKKIFSKRKNRSDVGRELVRAAEIVMRSSAFAIVIVDFGRDVPRISPLKWQGRLKAIAHQHQTRIALIHEDHVSSKNQSLGPLTHLYFDFAQKNFGRPNEYCLTAVRNKVGIECNETIQVSFPDSLSILNNSNSTYLNKIQVSDADIANDKGDISDGLASRFLQIKAG